MLPQVNIRINFMIEQVLLGRRIEEPKHTSNSEPTV